jgi:hypothetical protein
MLEFPLFVTVTLFELVLPALTFPNVKFAGLAVIATDAVTPVPLNPITAGELAALLAMLTLPLMLPAVVGVNDTLNAAVFPAAIVAGVVSPLAL